MDAENVSGGPLMPLSINKKMFTFSVVVDAGTTISIEDGPVPDNTVEPMRAPLDDPLLRHLGTKNNKKAEAIADAVFAVPGCPQVGVRKACIKKKKAMKAKSAMKKKADGNVKKVDKTAKPMKKEKPESVVITAGKLAVIDRGTNCYMQLTDPTGGRKRWPGITMKESWRTQLHHMDIMANIFDLVVSQNCDIDGARQIKTTVLKLHSRLSLTKTCTEWLGVGSCV